MLDGHHIRVCRCLTNELHHHIERFIRVVNHKVFLPDGGKNIPAMVAHPLRITRHIGREFQIRPFIKNKLLRVRKTHQPLGDNRHIIRNAQFVGDEIAQFRRAVGVHLHADHLAAAATLQRAFKHPHQIFGFFFDFNVAVTDDAEQARGQNLITREQPRQEQLQHMFLHDKARLFARQTNEALQQRWNGQKRSHPVPISFALQVNRHHKATVQNEGKGMCRVNGDGRYDGKDLFQEAQVEPIALQLVEFTGINDGDAIGLQLILQLKPASVLFNHQLLGTLANFLKLLGWRQPVLADLSHLLAQLPHQAGHTHHEKLIQIVAGNRQKAQPLQQGMGGIARLFQHPHVELQPRKLAVEKAVRAGDQIGSGAQVIHATLFLAQFDSLMNGNSVVIEKAGAGQFAQCARNEAACHLGFFSQRQPVNFSHQLARRIERPRHAQHHVGDQSLIHCNLPIGKQFDQHAAQQRIIRCSNAHHRERIEARREIRQLHGPA